jgi:hypothetical protein
MSHVTQLNAKPAAAAQDIPFVPAAAQTAVAVLAALPIAIPASLVPAAVAVVDYTSAVAVPSVSVEVAPSVVSVAADPAEVAVDKSAVAAY